MPKKFWVGFRNDGSVAFTWSLAAPKGRKSLRIITPFRVGLMMIISEKALGESLLGSPKDYFIHHKTVSSQ
jgi:hypothetical protein